MQLRDGALGCRVNFSRSNWSVSWAKRKAFAGYSVLVWIANWKGFTWASAKLTQTVPNLETCILLNGTLGATLIASFGETLCLHRFSAFWLRSKCSICSYQLNIWYEDHVSSSILVWFLPGDGLSGACSGSVKSWPCIAVPQGSAHFPIFIFLHWWLMKKSPDGPTVHWRDTFQEMSSYFL